MSMKSLAMAVIVAGGVAAWLLADDFAASKAVAGSDGGAVVAESATPAPLAAASGRAAATTLRVDAANDDAQTSVRVTTLRSAAQPFARVVRLRGETQPARRVRVQAQVPGLVVSEARRAGDTVQQGGILCRIETGEREAALSEARAALLQTEADVEASSKLEQRGYASETKLARDVAALEAARARVSRAEINLARLIMRAPFSGRLESDSAERGALLMAGSLCAEVIALNPIRIVAYASETQVGAIRAGASAKIRLIDGRELQAEVSFISAAADAATRTFRVEAQAPNADNALRAGMMAEVAVARDAIEAHLLPGSALTLDDDGRLGVRTVVAGRSVFAPVEVIAEAERGSNAPGVWVSGLGATAEVIVIGHEYAGEGAAVTPTRRAESLKALSEPLASGPKAH